MPELGRSVGQHRLVAGRVVGPDVVGDRGDRRRHAEGAEEPVAEQPVDRPARHRFEHRAGDLVAVVRVMEPLSGRRRSRTRTEELQRPREPRGVLRPGVQARGVREEVVHRDRAEGLGEVQPRQELVDRDVQIQPSRIDLLHRHDRGEGLGDGTDLEARLRPDGDGRGDVGHPAHRDAKDLLAIGDRQGRPGGVRCHQMVLETRSDAIEGFLEPRHRAPTRRRRASALGRRTPKSRCRARRSR